MEARDGQGWRRRRRWITRPTLALTLVAALAVAPLVWLFVSTDDRRASAELVPARSVALVLGAGVSEDGRPSLLLARRLDIAADLYRRGRVQAVLVSGNNSPQAHHETDVMRAHLVAAGVPARKIAADGAGYTTWDSCARAATVYGVRSATVVTQDFHLPRAVGLCRAAGIDAAGVGDASMAVRTSATLYGYAREIPAAFKAGADMILHPAPRLLGPPVPAVDQALAAAR